MKSFSVFDIMNQSKSDFDSLAKDVFIYQYQQNEVYNTFCTILNSTPQLLNKVSDIPFYPIQGFKFASVISRKFNSEESTFFQSSGTEKQIRSKHYVPDLSLYDESSWVYFQSIFPDYPLFAYTPAYNQNPHSSLIHMLSSFIENKFSSDLESRFLEVDSADLFNLPFDKPIILFGAAFGLLNKTDNRHVSLHPDSILVETGGMKTHRKEITREELHNELCLRFGIKENQIYSEYGMAELLSQAYKKGLKSGFTCPSWMKVSIRNPQNPIEEQEVGKEGQIAVIDLMNVHSCSFILTEDRGIGYSDGTFEVLGRLKDAELRGCNFLFERDL